MENKHMLEDKRDFWKDRFFRNPKTVIFDLDGTICDTEHRRRYVTTEPRNWDAFNSACILDKPNQHVMELYMALSLTEDYNILFFSGRSAKYWSSTITWLDKYLIKYDFIPFEDKLLMRQEDDRRPDTIVKKEMLDLVRGLGADIRFAVDDRDCVVEMFRSNGVPVFQCNYGDF